MKLISLIILAINFAVNCRAHEQFTFPPQFQTPHPGIYSSDKVLLPPESHTPMPYYQVKNINNLPFPFLPPSGLKVPTGYPTPLPITSSTSILRNDEDDSDDEDRSTLPPHLRKLLTERNPFQRAARREFRAISQHNQHPIERIDTKIPFQFSGNIDQSTPNTPTMTPRSIMIADMQRSDQLKAAGSYVNAQYVPQPSVFVSSTTETAIPILRLSNEMDLDGSFSYEALGADQTHYVQHSRMENMGGGKEEQVVEGSYSYVGSDGKTYTVHYIADSNGFRAIGDHLPVPPPVPEIIQRSIQYNLAEESKKPPNLKSWQDEEKENEINESERRYQLNFSPPRINNLFTGKTPESFSHSFAQASNTQNNLVAAASNQTPVHANIDYTIDQIQNKANSATISPQITFLASQGARVPSANTPQQTIARVFTTEKSTMPQLINYEANIKESDQENNKALWRWQYGINANANQNGDKNSISRSSGDDDIMINFGDMNSEQYTKMIKKELEPHDSAQKNVDSDSKSSQYSDQKTNGDMPSRYQTYNNYVKQETAGATVSQSNNYPIGKKKNSTQTETSPESSNRYEFNSNDYDVRQPQIELSQTSRPKLITQQDFIPPSQIVSKSYDYAEDDFESRKSKVMNSDTENVYDIMKLDVLPLKDEKSFQDSLKSDINHFENSPKTPVTQTSSPVSTDSDIKFTDFIVRDDKDDFQPLFPLTEETTTTEANLENMYTDNVFLKNLLRNRKNDEETNNKITDENKNLLVKPIEDSNMNKLPKYVQHQPKILNDNINLNRRPIDIADMLNFVSRNQFESSKIKARPKQTQPSYKQQNEIHYYTPEEIPEDNDEKNTRKLRTIQQNGELRGVIKNYKVLQRNNNIGNDDRVDRIRKIQRQSFNLPPLGRAGPSVKSYLPPVYV